MNRETWLWLLGGGALLYALSQTQTAQNVVESGVDTVTAAVSGWQSVQQGPQWVPVINAAEVQYGIPPNLLARMAYQESHFRQEIIDGTKPSTAGALGILQLMPRIFPIVNAPIPFTAQDTSAQIQTAAQEIARLYTVYRDWGLALAGYNWGQGHLSTYLANGGSIPQQTIDYVSQILADVPIDGASMLA